MDIHFISRSQSQGAHSLTCSRFSPFEKHIFKSSEKASSLKTRMIEQMHLLTSVYIINNVFHSLTKGLESIEKEFLQLGIEYKETAEDTGRFD